MHSFFSSKKRQKVEKSNVEDDEELYSCFDIFLPLDNSEEQNPPSSKCFPHEYTKIRESASSFIQKTTTPTTFLPEYLEGHSVPLGEWHTILAPDGSPDLLVFVNKRINKIAETIVSDSTYDVQTINKQDTGDDSKLGMCAFDLDNTLITTESGNRFPRTKYDWKFLWTAAKKSAGSCVVVDRLKKLHHDGHRIVVITNQMGVHTGKQTISGLKEKFEAIQSRLNEKLGVGQAPLDFIAALGGRGSIFRKPLPTAYELAALLMTPVKLKKGSERVDICRRDVLDACSSVRGLYVGDAAGRAADVQSGLKKDFSDSDFKFALNAGLHFCTPEAFFRPQQSKRRDLRIPLPRWSDHFGPAQAPLYIETVRNSVAGAGASVHKAKQMLTKVKVDDGLLASPVTGAAQTGDESSSSRFCWGTAQQAEAAGIFSELSCPEIVLLVGAAGSGKSTLARRAFGRTHRRVNQDELGNRDKCERAAKEALFQQPKQVEEQQAAGRNLPGCFRVLTPTNVRVFSQSVVVDATNLHAGTRQQWMDLGRKWQVPVRAVKIAGSPARVRHLQMFRLLSDATPPDDRRLIPERVTVDHLATSGSCGAPLPLTEEFSRVDIFPLDFKLPVDPRDRLIFGSFLS